MRESSKYFLAFATEEKFSHRLIKRLYDYFGDIESAWNASFDELLKIGLTEDKINKFIAERNKISPDEEYEKQALSKISFITYEDLDYPDLLKEIPDSPMILFYKGNIELLRAKYKLAVVGSRKCTMTGKANLANIIKEFADTELCIVSGLAAGIDTTAHQTALDNNIATIAVLGSGLNNIYPYKNKKLYENIIAEGGLVLSEYPNDSEPLAFHFPVRNRIVSGLSSGTLVAEANLKSGALITARLCLEQNRELMCIPGMINNPAAEGIYKLLKEGAGIVTCGQDILNIMDWNFNKKTKYNEDNKQIELTEEEKALLLMLREDNLDIDELAVKSGLNFEKLMILLTQLEIKDLIIQIEGGRYSAI